VIPQDANDTRPFHFRRLLRKPSSLVVGLLVIAGGIGLAVAVNPLAGAIAAAVLLLILLTAIFAIATRIALRDFFGAYANARGLTWSGDRQSLPEVTPLLRKGDDQYSEQTLTGKLPGGLEGTLSLYTYEEKTTDSKGNRHTTYYRFTLALSELTGSSKLIGKLYCNRKSGFRFLEQAEDIFRSNKRIHLESEDFADDYELFAGPEEDENRVRQLFEPSFIVWLTSKAPDKFGFELEDGQLCVNVDHQSKKAKDLDAFCAAAAAVATRFREEAAEERDRPAVQNAGPAVAGRPSMPPS
jgi:hypothetical protein